MTDFFDQARILAVIFESEHKIIDPTEPAMSYNVLRSECYFKSMDAVGRLGPMLNYLVKTDYLKVDSAYIQMTGKGLKITISLFQKFLIFIKRFYPDELSHWIKILDYHYGNNRDFIRESYHYIKYEPPMREAFNHYLNDIGTIENVDTFEVDVYDLIILIEDIYLNMDRVNKLFEYKFRCKLFLPPVAAQITLNRATRGNEIKLTELVATLGSIIDGIYNKEIDALLGSTPPGSRSINKIKALLDKENIGYDPNTIEILRALHHLRNTIFPIHDTGSKVIQHLKKVNINYPFEDKDAATKILQSFNSCLLEMQLWFKYKGYTIK
jgi:hypothetical protein